MPKPKKSAAEMPFLDHLEELRWRLIWALGALVIGVIIGLVVVLKFDLATVLQAPVRPFLKGDGLMITSPGAGFSIFMQLGFIVGIGLATPVIIYQLWAFLAPALHRHEQRVILPVLGAATVLFAFGVALAYFIVVPMSLGFFDYFNKGFNVQFTVTEYFGLVTSMCLTFGITFEVPVLLVLLSTFGIVTPQALGAVRKWAILIIVIASAIITPGDAITANIALGIPLYLLYELSVAVSWIIFRKQERRRRAEALADGGAIS